MRHESTFLGFGLLCKLVMSLQNISYWTNLDPDEHPNLLPIITDAEVKACLELTCFGPNSKCQNLHDAAAKSYQTLSEQAKPAAK